MMNYARERVTQVLKTANTAVLATSGLSGVQVSEFPCESAGLEIYLLVPQTSDHLFNLEQDDRVAMHTNCWELTGKGKALSSRERWPEISLVHKNRIDWYVLVKVIPVQIQVLRSDGWGPAETIDLTSLI